MCRPKAPGTASPRLSEVDGTLILTAALLALAGIPHCAAMCGAACAAAVGSRSLPAHLSFHLLRAFGYAAAGAVVASSVGLLAQLGQATAAFRPLWTVVHAAALVLGLWLLWVGRQPAWIENLGRTRSAPAAALVAGGATGGGTWQVMRGPLRAGALGSVWVAWPCGLLQSALVVAAMASQPVGGALVMAVFAGVSALGVAFGPWLLLKVAGKRVAALSSAWTARLAGMALAGASGWALYQGATGKIFCHTP